MQHYEMHVLNVYVYVCLLFGKQKQYFPAFAIKFNEMKKYFREMKHIFALFRVYPWEYQPDNIVQGMRNHSAPRNFQQVLTWYEKILAIKVGVKNVFSENIITALGHFFIERAIRVMWQSHSKILNCF